jgi:hypothetical protein
MTHGFEPAECIALVLYFDWMFDDIVAFMKTRLRCKKHFPVFWSWISFFIKLMMLLLSMTDGCVGFYDFQLYLSYWCCLCGTGFHVSKTVHNCTQHCATSCYSVSNLWSLCAEYHQASSGLACWCNPGKFKCCVAWCYSCCWVVASFTEVSSPTVVTHLMCAASFLFKPTSCSWVFFNCCLLLVWCKQSVLTSGKNSFPHATFVKWQIDALKCKILLNFFFTLSSLTATKLHMADNGARWLCIQ